MKAIVYEKTGAPDRLVCREVEKPSPRGNEVLVRIRAVSVNAADYRSMRMGLIPKRKIFGADIAGVVEEVGAGVRRFAPGDAVAGDISAGGFGGFAEYATAPERLLAALPREVSFEDASAVPMASLTALQALRAGGCERPGMKVLIHGAGGGVGTFAVQLAKYFGAEVTAVCGPLNVELVKSLGADRVVDYTKEDFSAGGERYGLILAVNGNRPLSVYRRALDQEGICLVVGGALPQILKAMVFGPVFSLGGRKLRLFAAHPRTEDLEFVLGLVASGAVRPVLDRIVPFGETAEAVRYLERGHARGKVVIRIGTEE